MMFLADNAAFTQVSYVMVIGHTPFRTHYSVSTEYWVLTLTVGESHSATVSDWVTHTETDWRDWVTHTVSDVSHRYVE